MSVRRAWNRWRPRPERLLPHSLWRHWHKGRHSGIPVCCVLSWLAFSWVPYGWWGWRQRRREITGRGLETPYMRCALCGLRDRREPLHYCSIACDGERGQCSHTRPDGSYVLRR